MSSTGDVTEDDLQRLRRWFADPVYKLKREVIGRVLVGIAAKDEEIARLRATVNDQVAAEPRAAEKAEQLDELRHAVDHALTCDQGTTLCRDCKRLLSAAMEMGR